MPTYDYECRDCGHTFEIFQNMADETLKFCPECSQNSLRRLIGGGTGIIFKGSGFYVNDARKSDNKKNTSGSSDTSNNKSDTSSGSKKTESSSTKSSE